MNIFLERAFSFIRRRPKFSITAGVILVFILFIAISAFGKSYPILMVNGTTISAARFEKNYASATIYYNNLLKSTANNATATAALARLTPLQRETQVLDQLVAAVLIERGAEEYIGSELDQLVREKIDQYVSDQSFRENVERLYGMPFSDFRVEVLIPQAKRDILAGRLFLHGENANDWLLKTRKSAQVTILSPKFRWDGEKIVPNGQ